MATKRSTRSPKAARKVVAAARHTFWPHKGNGFHPHLVRPVGLLIVALIVGVLQISALTPPTSKAAVTTDMTFSKDSLLKESNRVREQEGVGLLNLNDDLSAAAGLKARDMLLRQYWAHTAPDGTTPWYWFREVNYRYDFAGENLAKGFDTAAGVMTAWMESDEHRQNALNPAYQDVGFGIADGTLNGEPTTVVVALYGSLVGAPVLTDSEVLAATDGNLSLAARFGIGLQSLRPETLASLVLLLVTLVVALAAHANRKRLPLNVRKTWKRHHGLFTAIGTAGLTLLLILLYGDGQIL